jgi:acetyl-CoA carboxylase biotin carboxyl carrier protein
VTGLAAANRFGQPDPAADLEAAMLLAEVRESVLRVVTELPTPPGWIRISARDVAVELGWPAAGDGTSPPGLRASAPLASPPVAADSPRPAGDAASGAHQVTAATVGTFYRAPEPGANPFVEAGDIVQVGQQLAIVEAMKLMIPVEADASGRVTAVLKDDTAPVEFGEPLFLIERG